jgi:DNA-binding response OmpR family regulator
MSETDHILVVDDQQEICDLVREYLSDEGFRVSAPPCARRWRAMPSIW